MSETLTPKQARLLDFIKKRAADDGCSPSFEEMKVHIGLASKSGIHRLLVQLEDRGKIYRPFGRARRITIIPDKHDLSHISADDLLAELRDRGFAIAGARE